jgi:alpha-ketoglutarate-dependent taurine dioxygenase
MIETVNSINEFQSLHNSVNSRIEETYLISNKLHDYLEKRMVLDYHFRGE